MDVFLTGGTGYLGSRVARRLAEDGHRVRALYRDPERPPPEHANVLPVRGDILRVSDLEDVVAGSHAIIHTAAMVKSFVSDESLMRAVNVDAVAALLDLAETLRVPRFVYTSSFLALGPSEGTPRDADEDPARDRFHNAYERTKHQGDAIARAAQANGHPVVVLYPTVIYGPGELTDGNHVGRLLVDYLSGRLPGRIGNGAAIWNYAFIDDVVAAHSLALERARPGTRYVVGGENVSVDEFLALVEKISGVPAPQRRIPGPLARVLAGAMELSARVTGRQPPLTREVLDIYEKSWAFRIDRTRAELGYVPTPLAEGLSRTIDWARAWIDERRARR